jgi:hypothetical protein
MLRTFANGSIEYFIDRARQLVFGRWEGDFRGDELVQISPELWRLSPEIGRWNAIHDLVDYTGMLEHRYTRELMQLRATLVPGFDPSVLTAVVSVDPMKSFELKVTKVTAPERHFRLFGSNAAALRWIVGDIPLNVAAEAELPWWFDRTPPRAVGKVR